MAPSIYEFDVSFGALEIGTFVSMVLLGIATLQAWNYFRDFPEDPWFIKLMVASVYIADLLHSVMFAHTVHHYTILGFFNVLVLIKVVWSLESALVVEAFIIVVVQCYFGLRVLRVTQSHAMAAGVWILALLRMALTLSLTALAVRDGTLAVTQTPDFRWQAVLELAVGALTDVGTALALCVGLLGRRTGFAASDRLIDRLVAFTIGSGLLTSVISICQLVTYLTMDGQFVWIAFFSICSKLFSNSLLASLNQRGSNRLALLNVQRPCSDASTRVAFNKPYAGFPMELSPNSPNSVNKRAGRVMVIGDPHLSVLSSAFSEE